MTKYNACEWYCIFSQKKCSSVQFSESMLSDDKLQLTHGKPYQGAFKANEKQRQFTITFLCRAFLAALPSIYWLCLTSAI